MFKANALWSPVLAAGFVAHLGCGDASQDTDVDPPIEEETEIPPLLDDATERLALQAAEAGLALDSTKTAVALREEVMVVASLVENADDLDFGTLNTPGNELVIGGAYLCAPCGTDGSSPRPIDPDFYTLTLKSVDPGDGTPAGMELVLTGESGGELTAPVVEEWTSDALGAHPLIPRLDVLLSGTPAAEEGEPPKERQVVIVFYIESKGKRHCIRIVIDLEDLVKDIFD